MDKYILELLAVIWGLWLVLAIAYWWLLRGAHARIEELTDKLISREKRRAQATKPLTK